MPTVAASRQACGSRQIRITRKWSMTWWKFSSVIHQVSNSWSRKFQFDCGMTRVPIRGRGKTIPFAVNVLTASRTAVRLTPNCSPSSISPGKMVPGSYSPFKMRCASFSARTYERFFCAANCCALKGITNLPFSFYSSLVCHQEVWLRLQKRQIACFMAH